MSAALAELTAHQHRFTVDEFMTMWDAGVFNRSLRLELLGGVIVEVSPMKAPHASVTTKLVNLFVLALQGRAYVTSQTPLECKAITLPEPDVFLAEPRDERYEKRYPRAEEAYLVVEVTIKRDRREKLPTYAKAAVREVWIVDVHQRCLDLFGQPVGNEYHRLSRHLPGDPVSPEAFPDVLVDVGELLPSAVDQRTSSVET